MYSQVLPLLDKFVKDNSKNGCGKDFIDMFPKFFGAGEINSDCVLVFEDILDGKQLFYWKAFYFNCYFDRN